MRLRALAAAQIVRAIAAAAARWCDADFPPRVRLLGDVIARTGYAAPVVEYALDRLFSSIAEPGLRAAIEHEVGSLQALDGFVERSPSSRAWARGVNRVCIISSRTTIGVALAPAIFALCAKAQVLVKDREDGLIGAFFETLAEERDEFRAAAKAQTWDAAGAAAPSLNEYDAVVAFGRAHTLRDIRDALGVETRFIPFGPRASIGYVAREALADEATARAIAAGAARDVILYDGEGCMSLHALFVERGGSVSPQRFAQLLASAVEAAAVEFPPGTRAPHERIAVASARDLSAFRASAGFGDVHAGADAAFAVFVDPPHDEPPPFLPRALAVRAVDQPQEALAYLQRHALELEAFALADAARPDLTALAVDAGAVRIARFGELQAPPISGKHGGRPRIADFIRWVDDER